MTGIKNEKTINSKTSSSPRSNESQGGKDYRVFNYFCGKLPLNATSRMMGRIAGVNLPGWMRSPVHRVYGWMFNVQMNEIEHNNDLRQYSSLSHFFSRSLQVNTRPVDQNDPLVSPCDGRVLSCGEIFEGHLEQVKGLNYTLNGLLGPNTWSVLPNWLKEQIEELTSRPEYISVYKLEDGDDSLSMKSIESDPKMMTKDKNLLSSLDDFSIGDQGEVSSNDSLIFGLSNGLENNNIEVNVVPVSGQVAFDEHGSETNIFNVKDNEQIEDETIEEVNDEKLYNRQLLIKNHIYNRNPQTMGTSLFHCVIYLAPGDYHKFHSPTYWKIFMRRHFPGTLFSVSPKVTNWHSGVFCANERASYLGRWKYGFFAFVAVGALNVGSIKVPLDPELKTNLKAQSMLRRILVPFKARWRTTSNNRIPVITQSKNYNDFTFASPVSLTFGQQFGQFNFGSTIVLIFEAPKDFKFNVKVGDKVKVGQGLGSL